MSASEVPRRRSASEIAKYLRENPRPLAPDEIRLESGGTTYLPANLPGMPTVEVEPTTTVLDILDQLADGSAALVSLRRAELSVDDPVTSPLEAIVLPVRSYLKLASLAHGEKPLQEPPAEHPTNMSG
jgi:hypothetical protein